MRQRQNAPRPSHVQIRKLNRGHRRIPEESPRLPRSRSIVLTQMDCFRALPDQDQRRPVFERELQSTTPPGRNFRRSHLCRESSIRSSVCFPISTQRRDRFDRDSCLISPCTGQIGLEAKEFHGRLIEGYIWRIVSLARRVDNPRSCRHGATLRINLAESEFPACRALRP